MFSCVFTSCEDMLKTDSDIVIFDEDNKLNSSNDTIYSVIGVVNLMQKVADKTILINEMRGDLSIVNKNTSIDLQDVANFNVQEDNKYNKPYQYYAIINNCNYFIANADSAYNKNNQSIFAKELGVIKTYRAWAYFQLANIYGEVPFYTNPILSESESIKQYPRYNMTDICNYFIDDLLPYKDINLPNYGDISGMNSKKFFIPIRLMIGDLCLWAGRYQEAIQNYYEYLTNVNTRTVIGNSNVSWSGPADDMRLSDSYSPLFSISNSISFIPMEASYFNGVRSSLYDIFNSTTENKYFYEIDPSNSLIDLSNNQMTCRIYSDQSGNRDTIYFSKIDTIFNERNYFKYGDLRLHSILSKSNQNVSEGVNISDVFMLNNKWRDSGSGSSSNSGNRYVSLYTAPIIYLRFAEALNRAGFPESAFAVLKYGLTNDNIRDYVNSKEVERIGALLNFDNNYFTNNNTIGIHSRGCGDANADSTYVLPFPNYELASYEDSVEYLIPLVEDMIFDELALETCFEGLRFPDLMRYSIRRDDNSFLADKVAGRLGEDLYDHSLYNKLKIRKIWYLPLD